MKAEYEKNRVQTDISCLINEWTYMSLFLQGPKKARVMFT